LKTKRTRKSPPTRAASREKHCFSLIFTSPGELTDELENEILEAGCGDALLGIQGGELFLDFRREAPSFQIALLSAILAVERTGLPLELIRVDCS